MSKCQEEPSRDVAAHVDELQHLLQSFRAQGLRPMLVDDSTVIFKSKWQEDDAVHAEELQHLLEAFPEELRPMVMGDSDLNDVNWWVKKPVSAEDPTAADRDSPSDPVAGSGEIGMDEFFEFPAGWPNQDAGR